MRPKRPKEQLVTTKAEEAAKRVTAKTKEVELSAEDAAKKAVVA
jgi:hypothetical protein